MMANVLVSCLLLWVCLGTLKVYLPSCAAKLLPKPIDYTLSNFGNVPYGKTVVGKVSVPKSAELCTLDNELVIPKRLNEEMILLVQRGGGCKFVDKVLNAQKMGADLVMIYDNIQAAGDLDSIVVMKNDGHGHLVEIPSLFIRKRDGEAVLEAMGKCAGALIIKLQVEVYEKEIAQVVFWLDSGHRETYTMLRDFNNMGYREVLQPVMNYTLGYRVSMGCNELFCPKENCMGTPTKLFCVNVDKPTDKNIPFVSGREILLEQLRSYFLFLEVKESDVSLWWQYMIEFDEQLCLEDRNMTRCSYAVMESLGVSATTVLTIDAVVNETEFNATEEEPTVLEAWEQGIDETGVLFFPETTINGQTFYGLFRAAKVFEMVCESVLMPPQQCISSGKKTHYTTEEESSVWPYVLLVLLLMTVGFAVALFIYTKVITKEIDQQLNAEVNRTVQSHYAMKDRQMESNNTEKI